MITILGAGGPIANELAKILAYSHQPFRLVSRNPKPLAGGEVFAADLSDQEQTIRAVAGSTIVHLVVGLKYDLRVWQELWPRIMANTIEACKRTQAKLIFFDNVYMYGKVYGVMTEETLYAPCSKKGEIRAEIATTLMNEIKAGSLTAMIARAADFYGPDTDHSAPNILVFEPFAGDGVDAVADFQTGGVRGGAIDHLIDNDGAGLAVIQTPGNADANRIAGWRDFEEYWRVRAGAPYQEGGLATGSE